MKAESGKILKLDVEDKKFKVKSIYDIIQFD